MNQKDTMLIFDLDGTLWDSGKEVAESWNIILKKYLPDWEDLTAEDIHSVMGTTMAEIAEAYLPGLPSDKRTEIFDECQSFEIGYVEEHGGQLFPAVKETLSALKQAGYSMSIVSNCQTGYINAFLVSMNMQDYFCDYEEWGTTLKTKAENIRLVMERNGFEKAIYIGDIERDMIAATDAGIPFVHAAYGFGAIENPEMAIREFAELTDLFN